MAASTPDATELARMVRTGEASSLELVDAAIRRAEAANPDLNAIIHPLFEQAREEARRRDDEPGASDAPFAGVPFLTKDLMCATAGDPLHMGNVALKAIDHRAAADTYLAVMFRDSGLVNLGRTNTPELGGTITTEPVAYGPTANPWHPEHSPGGSSGGSAAAVAAGIVPMAHANDGGGSIRIPAAQCGLFGMKPSRGRVSNGPQYGEVWSGAAVEGVVSRSVRDSATLLDQIARRWPGDPYTAPAPPTTFADAVTGEPTRLRIGLVTESPWGPVDPECVAAVNAAGSLLEELGHRVDVRHPAALFDDEFLPMFVNLLVAVTAADVRAIGRILGRPPTREDFEGDTWKLAQMGNERSAVDHLGTVDWIHGYGRTMSEWWADFDILVTPVLTGPPPRLGELRNPRTGGQQVRDLIHFTAQFNLTGQPAMSVPLHWTDTNLPVGVQFVGGYGDEARLFNLAAQLEAAAPWAHHRPVVFAG